MRCAVLETKASHTCKYGPNVSLNMEPGHMVILDDATYDYLVSEFEAGLASVKSESDWISEEEMGEFINGLKSS